MKIIELGHIVLFVTDLEKVANFYRDILGFHEVAREKGTALFSGGRTHHELLLIEIGGVTEGRRTPRPGLYHVGFKIGENTNDLKKAYHELQEKGVLIVGTADHHVTHSLYVKDPDGNELELYVDVSDEWKQNPSAILAPAKYLSLESDSKNTITMDIFRILSVRYFLLAYGGIGLFILSPFALVILAKAVAGLSGCPSGVEFSNAVCTNGDILYAFSQAGWLLVITMPIGLILLGVVAGFHGLLYLLLKKRAAVAMLLLSRIQKKFKK